MSFNYLLSCPGVRLLSFFLIVFSLLYLTLFGKGRHTTVHFEFFPWLHSNGSLIPKGPWANTKTPNLNSRYMLHPLYPKLLILKEMHKFQGIFSEGWARFGGLEGGRGSGEQWIFGLEDSYLDQQIHIWIQKFIPGPANP